MFLRGTFEGTASLFLWRGLYISATGIRPYQSGRPH